MHIYRKAYISLIGGNDGEGSHFLRRSTSAMQRQTVFHAVKAAVNPNCDSTVFEMNLKECRATLP
jgi:hypothetical protein